MTNKSKETKVRMMVDASAPHFSKVTKVNVVSGTGGDGGEYDGTIPWENVTDKPGQYAPSPHDHDERYNTREEVEAEINYVRQQMIDGQGRVSTNASDEPGYLETKVDNTTVTVVGTELVVKSIDGLTVGATDISSWLAGTTNNVQTQIDGINDSLVAMTSGMHYRGTESTKAALDARTELESGDLVVVVADETSEDARTMYVYDGDNAIWDFIGAFTFSDSFISLKDTPESLEGQDGKALVARGERVVLEDISYSDITDKPESTVTQIDDAVAKSHEHVNKSEIDRIGINASGELTIDGVPYVPEPEPKGFLYANHVGGNVYHNTSWRWNKINGRGITLQDNGLFILEQGKTYEITITISAKGLDDWRNISLIDSETRNQPEEARNSATLLAANSSKDEAHSPSISMIISPTSTRTFGVIITSTNGSRTVAVFDRTSLVITEI